MIDRTETLGRLAATHPAASWVFLRHRLDFCCGGRTRLVDACREASVDADSVIDEIVNADASDDLERWDRRPLPELIDHILICHHEPLRSVLPALLSAATKVEHRHADHPDCPRGMTAHLAQLDAEIRQHMGKEEKILFPAILRGDRGGRVRMPVRVMMQEHDDHGASLRLLRELARNFDPPTGACGTWRGLYSGLERLHNDLTLHIHLENNILFPRALGS